MKISCLRLDILACPSVSLVVGVCLLLLSHAACLAAPANDNVANAQVIPTSSSFSVGGSTSDATQEAFEMAQNYPISTVHSVWYTWTPSISGTLYASISRAGGNTANIGVFKGPQPSAATYLTQDIDDPGYLTVYVEAGQQYFLSVGNDNVPGSFTYNGNVTAGPPPFFAGETALSNGIYYLAFPNGNYFGYYGFFSDPHYIYHFDLGYEYVTDAADGKSGVYLYDFASKTFFYTSPTLPFPYLYDFTLKAFLYYYPDPNNAGHYNTNGVRYFYNFSTGQIITK